MPAGHSSQFILQQSSARGVSLSALTHDRAHLSHPLPPRSQDSVHKPASRAAPVVLGVQTACKHMHMTPLISSPLLGLRCRGPAGTKRRQSVERVICDCRERGEVGVDRVLELGALRRPGLPAPPLRVSGSARPLERPLPRERERREGGGGAATRTTSDRPSSAASKPGGTDSGGGGGGGQKECGRVGAPRALLGPRQPVAQQADVRLPRRAGLSGGAAAGRHREERLEVVSQRADPVGAGRDG